MTTPETPKSVTQISRSNSLFIPALILALAIGGGLVQVGSGFASRSDNGIVVTGSARTEATADNAVWTLLMEIQQDEF